jgi:hypothetical protein
MQRSALGAILAAGLALAATTAGAKIDLVTLPGRDRTQVTIYRSADLTLVRETRELTFAAGDNRIQFSWADTLIDPTSVQMRFAKEEPGFRVLDTIYPANTQNLVVWNVEAEKDGKAAVEITYFASGMTWAANYSLFANADETKARIEPDFVITNRSGEDLENAETRLVVGDVNLVEAIADLARRGRLAEKDEMGLGLARRQVAKAVMQDRPAPAPAGAPMMGFAAEADFREVVKKAVSEYQLYTISGTSSIATGSSIMLPDPRIEDVPIELAYEYIPDKWGARPVKFYKMKNNDGHKMGKAPLPEGTWYAYRADGKDALRFEATAGHRYVPVGEDIELNLGSDGSVIVEEKELDFTRRGFVFDERPFAVNDSGDLRGYETARTMAIEIRNSNTRTIPMKVRLNLGAGDWKVEQESDPSRRYDRQRLEWNIEVPASAAKTIRYVVIERHGTLNEATK